MLMSVNFVSERLEIYPGFLGPNAVVPRLGRYCPAETLKGILTFGHDSLKNLPLAHGLFWEIRAVLSTNLILDPQSG